MGLETDVKFDGKRQNYNKIVKLIDKKIDAIRVTDIIILSAKW